jgi:hypothetical protein
MNKENLRKIEKDFYSKKNYRLFSSILLEKFKGLPENIENIISFHMQQIFSLHISSIPSYEIKKEDKEKYIQSLNKKTLLSIVEYLKKETNTKYSQQKNEYQPPPFPILQSKKIKKPDLHPNRNIDYFPPQPQSGRLQTNFHPNMQRFEQFDSERKDLFSKQNPPNEQQIDFSLENNSQEIFEDPEKRYQEMIKERKELELSKNQIVNHPQTYQESQESQESQELQAFRKSTNAWKENQNNYATAFSLENITSGVSEIPYFSPINKQTPETPETSEISETSETSETSEISEEFKEFKEFKETYFTVQSHFRSKEENETPYSFSLKTKSQKKRIEYFFGTNKNLVCSYEIEELAHLREDDLKNISVIECLDISLPKHSNIYSEPYLWLCVEEWGSNHIGENVPKGALAHLKMIPNQNQEFITMRPHMLERQILNKPLTSSLSIKITTSDGELLENEFQDKRNMTIQNFQPELCTKLYTDITNLKKGDFIYVYDYFPSKSETNFFSNQVFISSIERKKNELHLHFFFKDSKHSNQLDSLDKYLYKEDLLFFEYIKNNKKITNYFLITNSYKNEITISFTEKSSFCPKKISKIGFLKKNKQGFQSSNKKDIHYKKGHRIQEVFENYITLDSTLHINSNYYFFLQKKEQVSIMFRLLREN